jgi:hypothetical protein
MIMRPFIQTMIDTGNLPAPSGTATQQPAANRVRVRVHVQGEPDAAFYVEWPENALGAAAAANVALIRTQALTAYSNSPGAELVVPVQEFRKDFLDMDPESDYESDMLQPDPLAEPIDPLTGKPYVKPSDIPVDPSTDPSANAFQPRSVYVSRRVLNVKAITDWAESQGLKVTQDLHVSVAYSLDRVDWSKAMGAYGEDEKGSLMIHPGGPRAVEHIGPIGAVAILFTSGDLAWRHDDILNRTGATGTFPDYQPHVTLYYDDPAGMRTDLSKVQPYTGAIALGPEIWQENDNRVVSVLPISKDGEGL